MEGRAQSGCMHQCSRNLLFGIVVRGRGMLQWVGSLLFRVDGGWTDCFEERSPMGGGLDTIHLKIYALKVSE